MTQTALQTGSGGDIAWCVLFEWGYGADLAYSTWGAPITVAGTSYAALPTLGLQFGSRRALGDDEDWTITMPVHLLPASRLARTKYWGPIDVTVRSVAVSDLSNPVVRFRGQVSNTDQPSAPTLDIRCRPIKNIINDASLGLIAGREDNFWFGASQTNDVNLSNLQETGTVTTLNADGKSRRVGLTFDGSPTSPNADNRWRSGYIEVLGERIPIRRTVGSLKYDLAGTPDTSWQDAAFTLTPGWDGTVQHANYWEGQGVNLLRRFTGYGLKLSNRDSQRQAQ